HAFVILGSIIFTYLYFSMTGESFSRLWLALWLVNAFTISVGARTVAYPVLNRLRSKGKNRKSVVLIGDLNSCLIAYRHIVSQPSAGFDVSAVRLMNEGGCHKINVPDCRAFDS